MEIEGEVGTLDVFLSIDTTGSFGGEIDNLQAELRSQILPSLRDQVPNVSVGVGRFEDFPADPFGAPTDRPVPAARRGHEQRDRGGQRGRGARPAARHGRGHP